LLYLKAEGVEEEVGEVMEAEETEEAAIVKIIVEKIQLALPNVLKEEKLLQ
jgi:hypothetical protein